MKEHRWPTKECLRNQRTDESPRPPARTVGAHAHDPHSQRSQRGEQEPCTAHHDAGSACRKPSLATGSTRGERDYKREESAIQRIDKGSAGRVDPGDRTSGRRRNGETNYDQTRSPVSRQTLALVRPPFAIGPSPGSPTRPA